MGKDYLVSYNVTFHFEDEEDEDIENRDLLSERLGDIMYQWLQDGNYPHPANIKVEEF